MVRNIVFALVALPVIALAAEPQLPKVAVTDLAYEETVARYFAMTSYKDKQQWNNSSRSSAAGSAASNNESSSGKRDTELLAASGEILQIDRGELRKFTADIKGAMLKSGAYRLVQGKPYLEKERTDEKDRSPIEKMMPRTQRADPKLYDVIDRIKKGHFPNADYVLFTTINSIEPRQELNPIQGSGATSFSLAVELLVECSLISTKTYEIKAAFSAMGEGQDMRIINSPGQVAHLSKGKVLREVSKSLGEDVASQLEAQFDPTAGAPSRNRSRDCGRDSGRDAKRNCPPEPEQRAEKVIEYR